MVVEDLVAVRLHVLFTSIRTVIHTIRTGRGGGRGGAPRDFGPPDTVLGKVTPSPLYDS